MAEGVESGGQVDMIDDLPPPPPPALRLAQAPPDRRFVKRRAHRSVLWDRVTELDSPTANGHTHSCNVCQATMKIHQNSAGHFIIRYVRAHFERHHPQLEGAVPEATKTKRTRLVEMFRAQTAQSEAKTAGDNVVAARVDIAKFYIYNPQRISKSTLTGERFRKMIRSVSHVRPKDVGRLHFGRETLTGLVATEHAEVLVPLMKQFVAECLSYSNGNPFGQGIHDCVTLKNGQKNLALGLQCVDPRLNKIYTICIGFVPVDNGLGANLAEVINTLCLNNLGAGYTSVAHSTIADYAALNVAQILGHEREGCAMHADDKIARYAFGDLQRSRRQQIVEPFPAGKDLMTKAQKCAIHFSYSNRLGKLRAFGAIVNGGCPGVKPKTDICTTRVAARFNMIHSVLLLNRGLKQYAITYADEASTWKMTDAEWKALAEMEAIVKTITITTTLAQTETLFMGAIGYVIHCDLLRRLRQSSFDVLDLDAITANERPRRAVHVDSFTDIGRTCLLRARLEAERRLCGHKAMTIEGITGGPVQCNEREKACLILDPRTHHMVCRHWTPLQREEATKVLLDIYVEYILTSERESADLSVDEHGGGGDADSPAYIDVWNIGVQNGPRQNITLVEWEAKRRKELSTSFYSEFLAYSKLVQAIDWVEYCKEHKQPFTAPAEGQPVTNPLSLFRVDLLPFVRGLPTKLATFKLLLTHSRASIASVMAASFAERINSAAGIISTVGNTALGFTEVGHLVTCRMNTGFVSDMSDRYNHSKQPIDLVGH